MKAALDVLNNEKETAVTRVVKRMAAAAAHYYRKAEAGLDAFAADGQVAIKACIDVYGLLNQQILEKEGSFWPAGKEISFSRKWKALPSSKYWRIPWAYFNE